MAGYPASRGLYPAMATTRMGRRPCRSLNSSVHFAIAYPVEIRTGVASFVGQGFRRSALSLRLEREGG